MGTMKSMKEQLQTREERSQAMSPSRVMNSALNTKSMQKLLEDTLHENKGAFVASLIDLYGSDSTLQQCDAGAVVKEALKAVSLDLTINKQMGFVWIIPYFNNKERRYVPTFQLGYKGYIQLCMRSGVYRTINAGIVYEGEEVETDRLSGMVKISGERTGDDAIGYFAYFQTLNGFEKCEYWTRDQIIKHAERYSKSYQKGSNIWKDNFDEMARKTALRNLLSHYGLMSVKLVNQLETEDDYYSYENSDGGDDRGGEIESENNIYATAETVESEENDPSDGDYGEQMRIDTETGELSNYDGLPFDVGEY